MKKLLPIVLLIGLVQLLSACSNGYRSNAHAVPQNQQSIDQTQQHSSQRAQKPMVTSQHPTRNLMTKIAYSTIGIPYKWGGNNPQQGFDCSGLMKYIYKHATGLNIPRTAATQRDQSRTVNYDQLQPGDMLFFKTSKTANHVGVYVGNRKFVHAASGSAHVKVASMDSKYWHSRFVKFGTFL